MFVHVPRYILNEEYSCCLCTSRGDFRTRNTLVFCVLCKLLSFVHFGWYFKKEVILLLVVYFAECVLVERGMHLFVHFAWCFLKCNEEYTLAICALRAVPLERGILFLFVQFARYLWSEEYSCSV